ncbi:MAG: hypothetical protein E6I64_04895 [Chloroflexi bacterium]|nr:MAG: hypothetical protein E6I64_04895 [Chloroflexota bacterium]
MALPASTLRAFQYGLAILALTALIGLFNATKIIGDIDRNTLLTHLHSGTLGWITMGVFGIALALFARDRATGPNLVLTALATAAYVLAFWSGNFVARAVFGVVMLATIFGWWAWVVTRAANIGYSRLTNPQLSVVLGLTTLLVGSTLGVIVQVLLATNNFKEDNGTLIGAHAFAQVAGYLVLIAAGVSEWLLTPNAGRTRAGEIQSWLLFAAGLLFAVGTLFNVVPALLIGNLFQAAGVVMVVVRLGSRVVGASWTQATGIRHAAIAIPFLVLALVLTFVLTQQFIAAGDDPSKGPGPGLFTALSHTYFVGLLTNILFATILAAGSSRIWPWADHVIFWGLNIGAASFIAVLLTVGSSAGFGPFSHPVAFTAPIMGLSVLLAIVTYQLRLGSAPAPIRATAPA